MYYQVASKFVVAGSSATAAYTQAVSLAGANALYCTLQTVGGSVTSGTAQIEIGNDLENWSAVTAATANLAGGIMATAILATALAAQYARLKFNITGTAVFASDINTASL